METKDFSMPLVDSRPHLGLGWSAKLVGGHSPYALDTEFGSEGPAINEKEMSVTFPFASGVRRDSVGDLLEIGGIDTSRHVKNPVVLFDHGKTCAIPIALAETPDTKQYTVVKDEIAKIATCKAFFYQAHKDIEHARFCEQVFDMVAKRYIRAGSLGYVTTQGYPLAGDPAKGIPQGMHLQKVLLLEASIVIMPANMDTTLKMLSLNRVCGKPMSPVLVKSLMGCGVKRKAQMFVEGTKARQRPTYDDVRQKYPHVGPDNSDTLQARHRLVGQARGYIDLDDEQEAERIQREYEDARTHLPEEEETKSSDKPVLQRRHQEGDKVEIHPRERLYGAPAGGTYLGPVQHGPAAGQTVIEHDGVYHNVRNHSVSEPIHPEEKARPSATQARRMSQEKRPHGATPIDTVDDMAQVMRPQAFEDQWEDTQRTYNQNRVDVFDYPAEEKAVDCFEPGTRCRRRWRPMNGTTGERVDREAEVTVTGPPLREGGLMPDGRNVFPEHAGYVPYVTDEGRHAVSPYHQLERVETQEKAHPRNQRIYDHMVDQHIKLGGGKVISDDLSGRDWHRHQFNVGGHDYEFRAIPMSSTGTGGRWDVAFARLGKPKSSTGTRAREYSLTGDSGGAGEARQVMTHVGGAMDHFIRTRKPDHIEFSADASETGRVNHYDHLANILSDVHDFHLEREDRSKEAEGGGRTGIVNYSLRRKPNSAPKVSEEKALEWIVKALSGDTSAIPTERKSLTSLRVKYFGKGYTRDRRAPRGSGHMEEDGSLDGLTIIDWESGQPVHDDDDIVVADNYHPEEHKSNPTPVYRGLGGKPTGPPAIEVPMEAYDHPLPANFWEGIDDFGDQGLPFDQPDEGELSEVESLHLGEVQEKRTSGAPLDPVSSNPSRVSVRKTPTPPKHPNYAPPRSNERFGEVNEHQHPGETPEELDRRLRGEWEEGKAYQKPIRRGQRRELWEDEGDNIARRERVEVLGDDSSSHVWVRGDGGVVKRTRRGDIVPESADKEDQKQKSGPTRHDRQVQNHVDRHGEETARRDFNEFHDNVMQDVNTSVNLYGEEHPTTDQVRINEKEAAARARAMKKRGQKKSLSELRAKYLGKAYQRTPADGKIKPGINVRVESPLGMPPYDGETTGREYEGSGSVEVQPDEGGRPNWHFIEDVEGKAAPTPRAGERTHIRINDQLYPATMVEPYSSRPGGSLRQYRADPHGTHDDPYFDSHLVQIEGEDGPDHVWHSQLTSPPPHEDSVADQAEYDAEDTKQKSLGEGGFHPDVLHMAHQVAQGHGEPPEEDDWGRMTGESPHISDGSAHGAFVDALKEHGHDDLIAHAEAHGVPEAAHEVHRCAVLPHLTRGSRIDAVNRVSNDRMYRGEVVHSVHDNNKRVLLSNGTSIPISSRYWMVVPHKGEET